jgi:Histidinol-phosphate/aromatic aminotransferase and cobyric acid decarboxylase
VIPVPTFAMYKISALNTGHRVIEVPLDDRFDLDVGSMLEIIKNRSPELVFLSYPNNPTGNCFNSGKIEAIIRASSGIVVVDEAYFNFAGRTFLSYLDKYENLAVLKSLSKVGLAAMRIGIFIGCPLLVRELNKVRLPYNLNAFSQVIARFYVENEVEFQKQADKVVSKREELFKGLSKIDGIRPYPSDANFILFNCSFDTGSVYRGLIKRGILIKKFNAPGVLRNCMRVTVGNCEENGEFLRALRDVVAGELAGCSAC